MQNCTWGAIVISEPEMSFTKEGKPKTTFRVKIPGNYKPKDGKEYSDFIRVTCWNDAAHAAATLKENDDIIFTGRIRSYSTEEDGKKLYQHELVGEKIWKVVTAEAGQSE